MRDASWKMYSTGSFFLKERLDHRWRLLVAPDDSAHGQFLVLRNVARQAGHAQGVHDEDEELPELTV